MENEEPSPPEDMDPEEMRKLSPEERRKLREEKREKVASAYDGKVWPTHISPGLVRLAFANWGFNEMISGLPIQETKFHYSEWFIFS